MPDPMLLTLIHVLVLEEEWAITAEEWHEAPEKEKCEDVKRPESNETTEYQHKLVAWQLSIVNLHADEKLIACQEG